MYKTHTLVLVGSNSVHTRRYLEAVIPYFQKIVFITNSINSELEFTANNNVTFYKVNFSLFNLNAASDIFNILNNEQNAIVHIHQANSYAFHTFRAVRRLQTKPQTILTTWGSDILMLPHKNILLKQMVKYNLNNADIITSDSLFMSSIIKKLCPLAQNLYTINFGVKDFRNDLDISIKEDLILSNRLHKKLYNIDKIIIAFKDFVTKPDFSNYKLVIAANGEETPQLKQLVDKYNLRDKVHFTGMLSYSELISWYQKSKIFISIPDSDATSLSVLEAMSYGCYPILSNLPANLEWVIDGINGSICQNNDNLSTNLHDAATICTDTNKYAKLAQFNHNIIKEKAVFSNNINKFLNLYDSPINEF